VQITDVEAIPINVSLEPIDTGGIAPYRTNHSVVNDMDRILVRVETDEGLTGWGEVRAFLSPEATVSVIEDGVKPLVVGQSPHEIERFRRQVFVEYTNPNMFFAPVEMACWDIVGKALGKPVYELLGGWTAPNQTSMKNREHAGAESGNSAEEFAYCLGIFPPRSPASTPGNHSTEGTASSRRRRAATGRPTSSGSWRWTTRSTGDSSSAWTRIRDGPWRTPSGCARG
jgi:hypothetical protein